MFNVGDRVIYSTHGICHIDEICEKTYLGETKLYYVLHPISDNKLQISIPVDSNTVKMLELVDRDEAVRLLESFKQPGISWIEKSTQRTQIYSGIVKTGDREEIVKIVNTLMRKKQKVESDNKKFYEQDRKFLLVVQNILFSELAISLGSSVDDIHETVTKLINQHA